MTKEKKVTLKMTHSEAYSVMQTLYDAQVGYTVGEQAPERIVKLRGIISNLESAVESAIDAAG